MCTFARSRLDSTATRSSISRSALVLSAALVASMALPEAGHAQSTPDPSNTTGLFVGLRTGGTGVAFDNDRDGDGGGLGLRLGYGFSELFTGYIGIDGATISNGDGFEGLPADEDYTLVLMELGGRFNFRQKSRWAPFAEGSFTVIGLGFDDEAGAEVGYGGYSGSVGGGLSFFASPTLALEGGAAFTAGHLTDREIAGVKSTIDLGVAAVRLHLGLSWYPMR